MNVPVKIYAELNHEHGLPVYAHPGDSGMDIRANESIRLEPKETRLIPTGIRVSIPQGYEIQVRPRSGLALRDGLTLLNSPGTIDCDYRGELGVIVINLGAGPVVITHGSRIAQILLAPVTRIAWCEAESLSASHRGAGGFGSTGTASGRGE